MKDQSLRVLMVEDSEDDALLIIRELKKGGYNPVYERVETAAAMKKALKEKQWDIILCDYKMPKFNAPSAIAVLKETNIDISLIIVSGTMGEETAVECMRLGAQDYIMKGNLSRLYPVIDRELKEAKVRVLRKQMEETLRQNEEKYRSILENIQDGYFEVDLDGNFTFFNDSLCEIYGYPKEELMGMNHRQFASKEDSKKVFKAFNEIYRTGTIGSVFDYEVIRKSGTRSQIEISASLKKDSSGNPIGFSGTSRDITARKRTEEALRQSEEKYRTILENMQEGYFEVDLAGNFTFFNYSTCRVIGHPEEEMMGMNYRQYTDKENAKILFQAFNEVYKTGNPSKEFAWQIISKDGIKRYIEASISLRKDSSGKPIGFRGISRDIDERKKAAEALHQSEEKYRTILDSMQEGYFEVDLAGTFTFFNDSTCLLLGYSQEEMIGMNNRQYTDKENAKILFKTFNEVYRTGKPAKEFDWQVIRKDGTKKFFETSVWLLKDSLDKPTGFRGIIRDTTERKQTEEKLLLTLESLRKAFGTTIQVMVSAVEMRDPYTYGHQIRSADIARAIATEMGLPKDKIDGIRLAGSIHDIGKLSVPAEILSKPTKLTDLEFSLIKEHSRVGYEMLKNVESPWPLAQIVYQHHERMNGSGYPRNLKGDEIIIEARIMAVADVVEAMASHRPYRPGLGIEAALEEIVKNKGILYDAAVADACLRLFREKNYKIP